MSSFEVSSINFEALVDTSETLILRFVLSDAEILQDRVLASLVPSAVLAYCNVKQEPALALTFGVQDESALVVFRQRIILYVEKGFHETEKVREMDNARHIGFIEFNMALDFKNWFTHGTYGVAVARSGLGMA